MAANVSKAEYLKRYLSGDKKKKNKKNKSSHPSRMKIIETVIDMKAISFGEKVEEDEEDAPIVAEVIDDRPEEVKIKELYESTRWKKMGEDTENDPHEGRDKQHKSAKEGQHHHSDNDDSLRKAATPTRRHDSDSDQSPARHASNKFKHKRARHDSDRELSSNRNANKNQKHSDSDFSPKRLHKSESQNGKGHDSDSDLSPKRINSRSRNSARHDSGSDLSPPRTKKAFTKKQHTRNDPDSDLSPVRETSRQNSDSDLSPLRQRNAKSTLSRHRSQPNNSDSDLSPPRPQKYRGNSAAGNSRRPGKTLSGLKAGLQNAETLKRETKELREREKNQINQLDASLSGRDAETIIRDRRSGKKRDLQEENWIKEQKEQKKSEQDEKYALWGKGIEQTEQRVNKLSTDLYEMSKPLARYEDDEDLDKQLKSVIHDDDPMAEYIRKKQKKGVTSEMPEYRGPPAPPNRFGIKPGYRWDGVDRSNGFEKKYFAMHSNNKASQEESYLWSVQDM